MNKIEINETRCKACYLCINECPKKLIKKSERTNILGNNIVEFNDENGECLACTMCAMRCPHVAISVYKG